MNFKHWLLSEYDQNLHQDIDHMVKKGLKFNQIVDALKSQNRWPQGKQAKLLKLSIKRKTSSQAEDYRDKRLWNNLTDDQIIQNKKIQFDSVENYLKSIGGKLYSQSPISNSLYYQLPDNRKIRISDHELPHADTKSDYTSNPYVYILIDRFRTPEQTIDYLKNTLNQ